MDSSYLGIGIVLLIVGLFFLYPAYNNQKSKKKGNEPKYTRKRIWISGIFGGCFLFDSIIILVFAINPPNTYFEMFEDMFLFYLIIALFFLYPVFSLIKSHIKKKNTKYSKLRTLTCGSIGIFFLLGSISMAAAMIKDPSKNERIEEPKSSNNSGTSDTDKSTNASDNSSNKQAEQQQKENEAADKQKKFNAKVNKYLKKSLSEDQEAVANGDKRFAYAAFVNSIKYDSADKDSDSATVQVNTNFAELDNDSKSEVADQVQGVVGAALSMVKDTKYTPEEGQQGAALSFYLGKNAAGHSKLLDSHKYKWYNID